MKYIICIILLTIGSNVFSQLSVFDAGTGSGLLFEVHDSIRDGGQLGALDYDFAKTEVGLSWSFFDEKIKPNTFSSKHDFTTELSIGLNEKTFSLFKEGVQPGAGLSVGYEYRAYREQDPKITNPRKRADFDRWIAQLEMKSKRVKNGVVSNDTLLTVNSVWGTSFQLNLGWGYTDVREKGTRKGFNWSMGLNLQSGYVLNSESHLKEALFCKTTGQRLVQAGKSGYYDRLECSKLYNGAFKNSAFVTFAGVYKKKIKSFQSSDNDEFLTVIAIPKVTYMQNNRPKYDFAFGFGMNKFPRTVSATLLFELTDIGELNYNKDSDLGDVFNINIYFGIPIGK